MNLIICLFRSILAKKRRKADLISDKDEEYQDNDSVNGWLVKRDLATLSSSEVEANKQQAKLSLSQKRIKRKIRGDSSAKMNDTLVNLMSPPSRLHPVVNSPLENITDTPDTGKQTSDFHERKKKMEALIKKNKTRSVQSRGDRVERRKLNSSDKRRFIVEDDDDNINVHEDSDSKDEESFVSSQSEAEQLTKRPRKILDLEEDINDACVDVEDEKGEVGDVIEIVDDVDEAEAEEYSEDDGDEDTVVRKKREERLQRVLSHCNDVSVNLRRALQSWDTSSRSHSEAATSEAVSNPYGAIGEGAIKLSRDNATCVDLTEMAMTSAGESAAGVSSEILWQGDIQRFCPGLVLKPYQLVGVNWMKLLHLNGVNGVVSMTDVM